MVEARSHYTSEPRLNDTETPPQRRRGSQRRPQTGGEWTICVERIEVQHPKDIVRTENFTVELAVELKWSIAQKLSSGGRFWW